jgi:hypothetical protein
MAKSLFGRDSSDGFEQVRAADLLNPAPVPAEASPPRVLSRRARSSHQRWERIEPWIAIAIVVGPILVIGIAIGWPVYKASIPPRDPALRAWAAIAIARKELDEMKQTVESLKAGIDADEKSLMEFEPPSGGLRFNTTVAPARNPSSESLAQYHQAEAERLRERIAARTDRRNVLFRKMAWFTAQIKEGEVAVIRAQESSDRGQPDPTIDERVRAILAKPETVSGVPPLGERSKDETR